MCCILVNAVLLQMLKLFFYYHDYDFYMAKKMNLLLMTIVLFIVSLLNLFMGFKKILACFACPTAKKKKKMK